MEDVKRRGILETLIKRPNALEYARFNICWTNRCSMFKSDFVGTTQVIEQSNTADKPDTVLETEKGSIHNCRCRQIVRRIVIGRRGHDDDARRAALKARDAMRMSLTRIFSAVLAGNARRLPRCVNV
jgi:hypothetical protein